MATGWYVLGVCAVLALPTVIAPGLSADICYLVGLLIIVGSLWWATLTCRGASLNAWRLFALAATCWLLGDTLQRALLLGGFPDEGPGPADVFWLGAYPLLISGVVQVIRGRGLSPVVLKELRLDVTAVTVAVGIGAYQLLVAPALDTEVSLQTVVTVLYPLGDVAIFAVALSVLLVPGVTGVPGVLMIASLGSTLIVDGALSLLATVRPELALDRLDAVLLLVNALLAAAALHPDHQIIAQPAFGSDGQQHLHRGRVIMLGVALVAVSVAAALPGSPSAVSRALLLLAAVAVSVTVLARFYGVVRQRERAEERLAHLAHHDELTGLPNRALLLSHLGTQIYGSRNDTLHDVALFYLDLDGFKKVNDTSGHWAGDHVLQQVSHRLKTATRSTDLVARLGGDEFVVFCPDMPPSAARSLAQTLVEAVVAPIVLPNGSTVQVGVSVGLHAVSEQARPSHEWPTHVEQLLDRADAAMYQAKHEGGGIQTTAPPIPTPTPSPA